MVFLFIDQDNWVERFFNFSLTIQSIVYKYTAKTRNKLLSTVNVGKAKYLLAGTYYQTGASLLGLLGQCKGLK